jgi:hypothetical protein
MLDAATADREVVGLLMATGTTGGTPSGTPSGTPAATS